MSRARLCSLPSAQRAPACVAFRRRVTARSPIRGVRRARASRPSDPATCHPENDGTLASVLGPRADDPHAMFGRVIGARLARVGDDGDCGVARAGERGSDVVEARQRFGRRIGRAFRTDVARDVVDQSIVARDVDRADVDGDASRTLLCSEGLLTLAREGLRERIRRAARGRELSARCAKLRIGAARACRCAEIGAPRSPPISAGRDDAAPPGRSASGADPRDRFASARNRGASR